MKKLFVFFLMLMAFPMLTHAIDLLEVRLAPTLVQTAPSDFESYSNTLNSGLKMNEMSGLGADVLVNIPFFPVGVGVRYENYGQDKSTMLSDGMGGTYKFGWDVDVTRYAAVVNFRPIDIIVYAGAIATVGTHSGDLKLTTLNSSRTIDLSADGMSYSAGAEGGLKLKSWIIGAEAGYQYLKFKGDDTFKYKLDLSGVYAKILVGYRINIGPL